VSQIIVRTVWTDLNGKEAVTEFYVGPEQESPDILAGLALFSELSSAHQSEKTQELWLEEPDVAVGGAGDYPTHRDFIRLRFQKSNGAELRVVVPAPLGVTVLVGGIVDEGQADVAAVIAWCIENVTDSIGTLLVEYLGGTRFRIDE